MSEAETPYVDCQPGDLITCEKWKRLQQLIQSDICDKIEKAIAEIVSVPESGDSEKLDGKTYDELVAEIVKRAIAEANAQSGSVKLFLKLKVGETREVEHGLGGFPLVDAYQLLYFPVVCCEDKDTYPAWTTFYAFHSGEKKLRYTSPKGDKGTLEILPTSGTAFKVPFKTMLERYGVETEGSSALSDVLNELWKAIFSPPNDDFDDNQYCHSPWFEKCCREEMSLRDIKKKGHWDDLWIQFRPCKTIHFPAMNTAALASPPPGQDEAVSLPGFVTATVSPNTTVQYVSAFAVPAKRAFFSRRDLQLTDALAEALSDLQAPQNLAVCHYDFDSLGVTLKQAPHYPDEAFDRNALPPGLVPLDQQIPDVREELKVLLLLKC